MAKTNAEGTQHIVVKISSETDFVAKNDEFVAFANEIAEVAMTYLPENMDDLKGMKLESGVTIADALDEQVAKIGEKIDVIEYKSLEAPCIVAYNHAGNRIGVLVALNAGKNDAVVTAGKDTAMQIAAMNPVALHEDEVPTDTINRELEISRDLIRAEGKPEEMVEKIALGKLKKFYKDNTLLNQDFVKDPSKSVGKMIQDTQAGLEVTAFRRVALGA